jgi:phage terminase large subunit-like protein
LRQQGQKAAITLYSDWLKSARPSQITPHGDWNIWLILAGRGWGKTRTGAMDAMIYALTHPEVQVAVVTPTFGDLRRVAFGGVSGILKFLPRECFLQGRGQGYSSSAQEIRLYNGSTIYGFAAIEPERFRGPQFHRAWCDELCAWRYPEAFDQLMFGLRLGENPQCVITTTPKPTPLIHQLIKRNNTVITRGNTFENEENLAPAALQMLKEKYGNTRLGRQELYAEVLEDVEGALWSHKNIEAQRVISSEMMPELKQIVVGVDPAVTANEHSDETGIIVAGLGEDDRYYILDDRSGVMTADRWAREAIDCYYIYQADKIVCEVNQGGDLVSKLIRDIDPNVPIKEVRASRGKYVRAEPIAAFYEQEKVSHVGMFQELEDQLCSYTGVQSGKSPDRMDALVWAITELSESSGAVYWRIS